MSLLITVARGSGNVAITREVLSALRLAYNSLLPGLGCLRLDAVHYAHARRDICRTIVTYVWSSGLLDKKAFGYPDQVGSRGSQSSRTFACESRAVLLNAQPEGVNYTYHITISRSVGYLN